MADKLQDLPIDNSWTLFLDRDGVINERIVGGFVTSWNEFVFLPGVLNALPGLSQKFGRMFIVTNQRGVNEGIYTLNQLTTIHDLMLGEIERHGGRIDKIYYCPHGRSENCGCRKPKTGMALQAKEDFPEIDFHKSIMIGDRLGDMQFGKQLGMYTVWIENPYEDVSKGGQWIDFKLKNLGEFERRIGNS